MRLSWGKAFMKSWSCSTSCYTTSHDNKARDPNSETWYPSSLLMFVQKNPDKLMWHGLLPPVYTTELSIINIMSLLRARFPEVDQRSVVVPESLGDMQGASNKSCCTNPPHSALFRIKCYFLKDLANKFMIRQLFLNTFDETGHFIRQIYMHMQTHTHTRTHKTWYKLSGFKCKKSVWEMIPGNEGRGVWK